MHLIRIDVKKRVHKKANFFSKKNAFSQLHMKNCRVYDFPFFFLVDRAKIVFE